MQKSESPNTSHHESKQVSVTLEDNLEHHLNGYRVVLKIFRSRQKHLKKHLRIYRNLNIEKK